MYTGQIFNCISFQVDGDPISPIPQSVPVLTCAKTPENPDFYTTLAYTMILLSSTSKRWGYAERILECKRPKSFH